MNTVFLVKGGSGKNNVPLAETEINAGFNLNIIADELDVEVDKLLSWNPNINDELQKKGEGTLYLPTDLMPDFLLRKTKILSRSIKEGNTQNTEH
jgi:membrane-bound lytic murein transglycosylase D